MSLQAVCSFLFRLYLWGVMKFSFCLLCVVFAACATRLLTGQPLVPFRMREQKPLLVVVLMVKNEATVICQTLQPFVDAGVQHYFIFDTGSTDSTVDIVTRYFSDNNIQHAHVAQELFIDFATSRNSALALAEQQFPDAEFMIMLDAEWYLQHADMLLAFCKENKQDAHDAFLLRINSGDLDFYLPRLMRPRAHLRFVGAIHEHLEISTAKKVPAKICFEVKPAQCGQEATKKRLLRDLAILQKKNEENPDDTRTLYFLAQTHVSLNNLTEAYQFFRSCVARTKLLDSQTPYWQVEQAYQASYHAGIIAQELAKIHSGFTWQMAHNHFMQAFIMNPCRAEPLVRIAQHYWDEHIMHLCFIFARHAAELPYPEHATGLVEKDVYSFKRYDLLGACAGNIGRWDVAEWATRKALEAAPHKEHLHKNLKIIIAKKAAAQTAAPLDHYEL